MSTDLFQVISENILKVLPDVDAQLITPERQLRDLGANSIDRMEIVMGTMEDLGINVPVTELSQAKDIGSLLGIFQRHYAQRS
ncbi:phosphopantetheine-binding protein [Corallococcus exercitus]|uniref:Phosphopantetheine-binding protein n=1 Tax=Corallococcus exercitus TaxID=2316736 RepID=A0A7Y4JT76_9BACT|nr:phosphopantetheine-binding protein [Corallococcus exercitus]NOK09812.1 phosphopantetheine-binding protein [Corallococcus exercitus]